MCEWRSVRICCHESPHGEAVDPLMRRFHTVSRETVWKITEGIAVAYPPHHGRQEILHRPVGCRMEVRWPAPSRTKRARTPQDTRFAGDPRRRLLRPKERLPVAVTAEGLRTPWKSVYDWFSGSGASMGRGSGSMPPCARS